MKNLLPFEKSVLSGLEQCGIHFDSVSDVSPLGVAVSGGADSVSLLLSLTEIFGCKKIRAVTVNHGIRSKEESGGDADFVKSLCGSLGVKCKVVEIPAGKIAELSKNEKKSVEEIARKFRYEAFETFIIEENLLSLCLAHNQGDQLETLLMRFLQGSALEGMGGIVKVRGKISRPLLEIPRKEIEAYLVSKNQSWRTDSTNFDTKYLRNKVRNVLVPVLNENFSGWQKAVLSGAKKSACDEDFINSFSAKIEEICFNPLSNSVEFRREFFYRLHDSMKRHVFFEALNKVGFGGRFPYRLFEEIASWKNENAREVCFEGVKILLDSQNLAVIYSSEHQNIDENSFSESGFSFFFSKDGDCAEFDGFVVRAENENLVVEPEKTDAGNVSFAVDFPCLVRSFAAGDEVLDAAKKFKPIAKIFSDWKIPQHLRDKVIVIEEIFSDSSRIKSVIASPLGFKNWIVDFEKL